MIDLRKMIEELVPSIEEEGPLKCPKCGERLVTTITLYTQTHVYSERWSDGKVRVRYEGDVPEPKRALVSQAKHNYGGDEVEEHDELQCKNPECDYWVKPINIEFPGE